MHRVSTTLNPQWAATSELSEAETHTGCVKVQSNYLNCGLIVRSLLERTETFEKRYGFERRDSALWRVLFLPESLILPESIYGTSLHAMAPRYTAARLTLASHQFKALVLFYRQLLQLEPAVLIPNVYAEFHLPDLKLGIFQPKAPTSGLAERSRQNPLPPPVRLSAPIEAHSPTGMSLCLDVDDLEAAIAHLTQLGYPPPEDIMTASHGREIYASDPDGNWLILHQAAITYNKT